MNADSKLMEMLTGYAASHQNPFNVFVHMIGIPTIMFGVLVPLSWLRLDLPFMSINLAQIVLVAFVAFYFTLDALFAIVFAALGAILTLFAMQVGTLSLPLSGGIAAGCFFGGYLLQRPGPRGH